MTREAKLADLDGLPDTSSRDVRGEKLASTALDGEGAGSQGAFGIAASNSSSSVCVEDRAVKCK